MRSFKQDQRVQVMDEQHGLHGRIGTVRRLCMSDHTAWVRMDDDLPAEYRSFPADDQAGRGKDVRLHPEECTAVG